MTLQAAGISHKTAGVAVRERLARRVPDAYARLKGLGFGESLLLDTCNRSELYVSTPTPATPEALFEALAQAHGADPGGLSAQGYVREGGDAVRHAFEVVSGLDALALGETQVLGQAKEAYCLALEAGAVGPELHALFQQAFAAAKRVHTETAIGQGRVSVSSVAVDLAGRIFQSLSGHAALVLGAGEMGRLTAKHLAEAGVRRLLVANRTPEAARALAEELGGEACSLDDLPRALAQSDIVVAAAASDRFLVTPELVREAMRLRRRRPLFLIDIAVPRTIDPAVKGMDNVYAYDLDALEGIVEANLKARAAELAACGPILDEAVSDFLHAQSVRGDLGPLIASLRERLHAIRTQEVARAAAALDPAARAALEEASSRIVNKILHDPIEALRSEAREGNGTPAASALRRLFRL